MRTLCLVLALSLPALGATPRVSVLAFSGPKGDFVREQFLTALCDQLTCVSQSKVTTPGKKGPDWAKVKQNALDAVLMGKIAKVDGKAKLKLKLLTAPGAKPAFASVVLNKQGELSPKQDRKLMVLLEKKLKTAPKSEDPQPSTPETSEDETEVAKAEAPAPPAKVVPAKVARAEKPATAAKPEPAEDTIAADEEDAEITTAVPTGSAEVATEGKHYKPLPPELLGMTPRI